MNKISCVFSLLLLIVVGRLAYAQNNYRNWSVVNESKKENIALIIANNNYESGGSLNQPIPTAKKLENKLIAEGFDVMVGRDLNRMHMISILDEFSGKFQDYNFAMVFYLGHGFQINGENYLIPIDANPGSKDDVEVHAINVDYVMRKINDPKTPKVIVLDACRDNPFAQNWSSSERSGSNNGFGNVSAPRNAEIFFTTGEGTRVRDDNPYLNYFMQELKQGACLSDIKRIVSKRIYEYNSDQIPASYGQLFDKVCFGNTPQPDPVIVVNQDSDGDGINDSEDDCPYEVGTASNNGCPAPTYDLETLNEWMAKGDNLYPNSDAMNWYLKAANGGLAEAQFRCGSEYGFGGIAEEDPKKSKFWYTKAALQGHTYAQNNLGVYYINGPEKDDKLSFFWIQKAAESGDETAILNLALAYKKGTGTEKDYAKSLELFLKIEDGYHLGWFYRYGQGVPVNFEKAIYWYEEGSKTGATGLEEFQIGTIYEKEMGADIDLDKAKYWFQKSCDKGYSNGCDKL